MTLEGLAVGADAMINLVGILNEGRRGDFDRAHIELARKTVAACRAAGVPRLLHMSALNADAQGPSRYLASKGQAEAIIAGSDLEWTIFRPSVIFGPEDSFLNMFARLERFLLVVALACADHPHFVPSLAEAGEDFSGTQLHYSVDTVRYFRHTYHEPGDHIFFIIGADAFLDIPVWKEYETLLGLCDFIIANRPGIRAVALRLVIPPELTARPGSKKETEAEHPSQVVAQLHCTTVYLLENVASDVSATDIRRRAQKGQSIHGLVSARVEEYILKQGLYR